MHLRNEGERARFREYLRKTGKSKRIVEATVSHIGEFEDYLRDQRHGKTLEKACPDDLEGFISYVERGTDLAAKKYLLGIRYYYEFCPNEEMAILAAFRWNERMARSAVPAKLKDFRGVKPAVLAKLEKVGIRNAEQIVKAGKTSLERQKLSVASGASVESILEIVKLADLSRIQGVKGIRARLYYDAGVDTMDKLAEWKPEELRAYLEGFVKEKGFDGVAPLPKEIKFTVETAKRMPRIVEY